MTNQNGIAMILTEIQTQRLRTKNSTEIFEFEYQASGPKSSCQEFLGQFGQQKQLADPMNLLYTVGENVAL